MNEALPPWGVRLISELNARDEFATSVATDLSVEQLNWNPRPGSWSIGQCLEHLSVGNEMYCNAVANALEQRATGAVEKVTPRFFGRMFIRRFIEPSENIRPAKAPKVVRPSKQISPSVLDRFIASNETARELIYRARNHDVNRIRFRNPFVPGLLNFTVGTAFEILSKHDLRHLLQAERVKNAPGFPTS